MNFSEETVYMANAILESIDNDEVFIEHHGVKGQKRGVRRYQNEDGSLTDLGRRHYGIFGRVRNYFSPASKGYRAAMKQKQIESKIQYQQKVNELKRLKNENKEEEYRFKQMKRLDRDERKGRQFEQKMKERELKSKERQFNLQQKTAFDIQKQKDTAQAAREQAQRKYQTQQEIAKGKTLLGHLQKGAKMVAAISGIAGSGKKIAEAIGIDTSKFVTEWKAKYEDQETTKTDKPKNDKTKDEKPKTEPTDNKGESKNNSTRVNMDLSNWDPKKQYSWNTSSTDANKNDSKNRLDLDLSGWDPNKQYSWNTSSDRDQKKKLNMDLSDWDPNKQYRWNADGVREKKVAEGKARQEAIEQARDIKQRWDNFYKFQQESRSGTMPKSDTGSFISSVSPSEIADMILRKVPETTYEHINLGAAMRTNIGEPTDYREEFKKRKDWQRKQRFGHDDMQEDAGEVEDAK